MSETQSTAQGSVSRGDFVISRTFDAPRERVWRAWAEKDQLAQWFGPAGAKVVKANLDLRPGGVFHSCLRTPEGKEMWAKFVYREVTPPQRPVWEHSFSDAQERNAQPGLIGFMPTPRESDGSVMQSTTQQFGSKLMLVIGWLVTILATLFMLADGVAKLIKPHAVVLATVQLGYPERMIIVLGVVLTLSAILYVLPRTAVLGAIVLTGYLGGAVASQVRIQAPSSSIAFPILFGVLVWLGLFLRDRRLRALIPFRS